MWTDNSDIFYCIVLSVSETREKGGRGGVKHELVPGGRGEYGGVRGGGES